MEDTNNKLTKHGAEKLEQELKHLISDRARISKAIGEAREHGDLKENAEYDSARELQGRTEARISFLESILHDAEIVDPATIEHIDEVSFGAWVKIKNLDDEREMSFRLVGAAEVDPQNGLLSINSPLGQVLSGRKIDDIVVVEAPAGNKEYQILEIKYN